MTSRSLLAGMFLCIALGSSSAMGASTDLNGDFRSDLLWRNVQTGQVYRMLMNGFSIAGAAQIYHEPNTAWKVVADADFNGDGYVDLLWRNELTGMVYYMPMSAAGTVAGGAVVVTEPNLAWRIVGTPDINADDKADILWWNSQTGKVFAMLMNGAAIVAQGPVYTEPNTNWQIVAVGDFAASGKTNQLLWRNMSTGHVYLMTVNFAFSQFTPSGQMIYHEPNLEWRILGTADFDGDLASDILWHNDTDGRVFIMLMNGGTIEASKMVYRESNTDWKIVAHGDYNGDDRADLLWRNETTGRVYLMLMNGLAIGSASMVYQEPNIAWRLLGPWDYSGDDSLPVTVATVNAGIDLLAHANYDIPPNCAGSPRVNCNGGVPQTTQIALTYVDLSTGQTGATSFAYALNISAQTVTPIQVEHLGVQCTVTINTALGSLANVYVGGNATFSSTIEGGPMNRLQPVTNNPPPNMEDNDFSWSGNCSAFSSSLTAFLKPEIETLAQEVLSTLLCGSPGPELFGPCP